MKRLLCILKVLILFLMVPSYLHAYDFEDGGIYYNIITNTNTVRVTYRVYAHMYTYEGDIIIPKQVSFEGAQYRVVEIDQAAFLGNVNLKSVQLPNSIIKIWSKAFSDCSSLSAITIPNSVTEIGYNAFEGCKNLVSVDLPNTITAIGSYVFKDCKNLPSINLPNSIKKIGSYAFGGCDKLSKIYIPNNVTSIGMYAFSNCISLPSIILPKDIESIDSHTFSGCTNLSNISIPQNVKNIGSNAFEGCKKLSNVEIHDGTTTIGMYAFSGCIGLKTIILPNSLTAIGSHAFYNCENLEYVESQIVPPFNPGYNCFSGIPVNSVLCVPFGTKEKYQELDWKKYFNDIVEKNNDNSVNLSISVMGEGSVLFDGSTIRGKISTFTLKVGTNATIKFNPDNGCRIKSVKVDNSDVTSIVSNKQYTISNIKANTNVEVVFEAIPPTTYILTITCSGNGSATFDGNTVRDKSTSFSVNEGANATITITPDNGYRIKSVKVNNSDVTNNVFNNCYSINNISSNTTLNVEFEAIPPTIYTLTISATGNGHVSCNDISVESDTQSILIEEGSSAVINLYPNEGYQVKSVKENNSDVTLSLSNNQYTINNMMANTTVEVEFEIIVTSMTVDGVNYVVNDQRDKTIQVAAGDYGVVLEVPATVRYSDRNWALVGIEENALTNCQGLAAVIWEPEVQFNAKVNNPNFLLYVSDEKYASRNVKNVVVNGVAESIELTDAANGNDFYSPRAFKARSIVYSHNYQMETGIGDSRGWETIVLPFDVQKYTHATKGELESFTIWSKSSSKKPFWLFELTASGYKDVAGIKANTPYIISMPNNIQYEQQYQIPGVVTFSASNVEVQKSDNMKHGSYQGRSLVPNYTNKSDENYLALNVSNNYVTNPGKDISGSKFVRGLRAVHPFEAYMITTDNTRSVDVMEGITTAIRGILVVNDSASAIKVYDTRGVLMKTATSMDDVRNGLKSGIYIVNGKKMVIK